jgi:hypothetical protein
MNNTPWLDEPLECRWVDEATGLPCYAWRFHDNWTWCGYVGYSSKRQLAVKACVHGGVSFHGKIGFDLQSFADAVWLARAGHDTKYMWWMGFSNVHLGDFVPVFPERGGAWRSLDFVRTECAKLALAIRDALDGP